MKRNPAYLPIGKNPKFDQYHYWIDKLSLASQILNGNGKHPNVFTILYTRDSLKDHLIEIIGGSDGTYKVRGEIKIGHIPFCKLRLKELNDQFETIKKKALKEGRKAPSEWPQRLLDQRLEFEARILVLEEEALMITKKLEEYQLQDQVISDKNVLREGPKGSARMQNGSMVEIDGLNVSTTEQGVPYIDDERAPMFDGFSTSDYFEFIVKPWAIQKAKVVKEIRERVSKGELKMENVTKAQRTGCSVPWPTMPKSCKNYKSKIEKAA